MLFDFHKRKSTPALASLLLLVAITVAACESGSEAVETGSSTFDDASVERLSSLRSIGVGVFDPQFYIGALPRDAIVPIYEPEFVSPEELDLWPNELVMGIEINGEAHAYPIGLMRRRELVNDVVGGVPVLVSW